MPSPHPCVCNVRLTSCAATLLLLCLWPPAPLLAQEEPPTTPFTASLTLTQPPPEAPLKVGQPFDIAFLIDHPPGALIMPPELIDGSTRWGLTDPKVASAPGKEAGGATQSTLTLTLIPWRAGRADIPPIEVGITGGPTNEVVVIKTPEIPQVRVLSTLDWDTKDEPTFHPTRPPVRIVRTDYTLVWALGIGGGLLGAVLLTWAVMRRRALGGVAEPPRPAPHLVALEALSVLASSDIFKQAQWQEYYIRLSEIVRDYLGHTYDFQGTELTTTEIMAVLADRQLPAGFGHAELKGWLRACDRVKFTASGSTQEEAEGMLRQAITLVELTRHLKEEEEKEAAVQAAPTDPAPPSPDLQPVQPDDSPKHHEEE